MKIPTQTSTMGLLDFIKSYLPKSVWDESRKRFRFPVRVSLDSEQMLEWIKYVFPKALDEYNRMQNVHLGFLLDKVAKEQRELCNKNFNRWCDGEIPGSQYDSILSAPSPITKE